MIKSAFQGVLSGPVMELLNIGFAILCLMIAFCVLPGVFGIYLLSIPEERKRGLRNSLCNCLFGVSNGIPFPSFERVLLVVGLLALLFSAAASWFILLRNLI